uniref:Copper amine oxidase-like N-terminal domain-containing protein n=1 Tax=Ammonifex degensii TaxID=42838 RepID=A0A7C1IZD8_9THEO
MVDVIYAICRVLEDCPREVGNRKLSALPSPRDPRNYKYAKLLSLTAPVPIPRKTNYRANMPPVFDQGRFGTCTAASSAWGWKAWKEINEGAFPYKGLSARFVYDISKNLDGIPNIAGTYLHVTFKVYQKYGICPEELYRYEEMTSDVNCPMPPREAIEAAARYKIKTYAQIASPMDTDRDAVIRLLREAVAREGPIQIAHWVFESFLDAKPPHYIIPEPKGRQLGLHADTICDMDDDRRAFLIRNTWPEWGDGGYAWMPYDWVKKGFDPFGNGQYWAPYLLEAWTATDIVMPKAADRIEIEPNKKSMNVDGQEVWLDEPATISPRNRMLLPVRSIATNAGYLVDWGGQKAILTKFKPEG